MSGELREFLATIGAIEVVDKLLADEIDDLETLNELSRDELRQMYGLSLGKALKIKAGLRERASNNDSSQRSTCGAVAPASQAVTPSAKAPLAKAEVMPSLGYGPQAVLTTKNTFLTVLENLDAAPAMKRSKSDDCLSCTSCDSALTSSTDTTSWRSTTSFASGSQSQVMGLPLQRVVKPMKNDRMGDEYESDSTCDRSSYISGTDSEQGMHRPRHVDDVIGGQCDPNWSVGSKLHELGICRPCHYHTTKLGCQSGKNCKFCHCPHKKFKKSKQERKSKNKEQEFFNTDDEM
eukprot:gnl/TRDRNA2_/TRDRNA2_168505_c0_seq1.p1 gnl/TRDRNA2_/TRDRNA2_168505_c0~~gnl/TRDRNA2_/TRDRNA2_168505_c0_seq1.p1  ORF type:complete len:292 (+),score=46.81 gnl/TRDRNA2_/TRDRNA2_168505_c0_seq1:55-930(+)